MFAVNNFFDIARFTHRDLFTDVPFVWDGLKNLCAYMDDQKYPPLPVWFPQNQPLPQAAVFWDGSYMDAQNCTINYGEPTKGGLTVEREGRILEGASVIMAGVVLQGEAFSFGEGVLVESGAFLQSPAIIGRRSGVRQGAYLRGYCLVGRECVVGHATEVKHSIFFDGAKAGHFAYVGDSILGNEVNLGAGTKLANLRFMGGEVTVRTNQGMHNTGLKKLGALLGDRTQTGCNSVTNPGTLLGTDSMVLPCVMVPSGLHPSHTIIR